jgi:hypothetical protein
MGGTCSTHGGNEKYVQDFRQKTEGKTPLGDMRRWEDNIKTDLNEILCEDVAQIRVQ